MTIPPAITNLLAFLPVIVTILGAYMAALWFCMVIWTFRDIQKRTTDVLVQILASIMVLFFNLAGLWLYLILRPPDTLADVYARSLEEEALMRDIGQNSLCPQCKEPVDQDFLICPACGSQVKRTCGSCQRLLQLDWRLCPYCGEDQFRTNLRPGTVAPDNNPS